VIEIQVLCFSRNRRFSRWAGCLEAYYGREWLGVVLDVIVAVIQEIKMGKKLKALAGNLADNQFAHTVKGSAQQIWLAGLGAFAKAQEEGGKVFDVLVKEGATVQARTRKMTDEKLVSIAGKAAGTWDRLEQAFEDRVARSLGSLGVPSKKDLDKLTRRVEDLTTVVQSLQGAKGAPKATGKTTTKPVARKPAIKKPVAKPAAPKTAA
jgi:poly(hydroxyalkanoate) granule-associated protein